MNDKPDYITVTNGMRGYFAVHLTWNPKYGGFYEPQNTGSGSYRTSNEAAHEGRQWAAAEGLEFRP